MLEKLKEIKERFLEVEKQVEVLRDRTKTTDSSVQQDNCKH